MQLQSLLEKTGLSLDDLNEAERKTLFSWMEDLSKNTLTVEGVKFHVSALVEAVQHDIAGIEEPKTLWGWLFQRKRDVYLKARLKNYVMLRDFVTSPERAQKWIEAQVKTLKP